MPYSKAPVVSTYETKQVPAAYNMDLRPQSAYLTGSTNYQDAGMINLIPMKGEKDEVHAITRQPVHAYPVGSSDVINRGCYVWEKSVGTTYYFSVNGTGVFTSADRITWTQVTTLSTSATTPVRFTEFIDDVNTKKLILVDGVEGYVFTSNAAGTKITDVDFPSPHVPFPVFMDGYLFLAKAGTGDVYNSDLNHPENWTPGSFLSSELYPDDIQALVKINNYLLVIGTQGCEFFFDAGTSPGTPLARYDGGSLPFGTLIPNSIASNKNVCMFIANNNDGENVLKIIEDFKDHELPSFLIPALNSRLYATTNPTTAAAVRGFFFRYAGKLFYGLAFQGDVSAPNLLNATFILNAETGWWSEFRCGANGTLPFPVYFTSVNNTGKISTYVSGHISGKPFFGAMEDGAVSPFTLSATDVIYGNYTSAIYTEIRTPNLNFGNKNRKFMSRFGVEATENTSSTSTADGALLLSVSWSDDDFATYNTPRSLRIGAASEFPFITQLGSFRQRTFKVTYNDTKFLRYKFFEMDINKGQQ